MERFGLEKLHFFGQEGILAPNEPQLLERDEAEFAQWIALAKKYLEVPELLSWSEHDLSERLPKSGSRKSARILSAAMMIPVRDSSMWKVFPRMRGTRLSYICQNAQMERNARPTRTVRLLSSSPLRRWCS